MNGAKDTETNKHLSLAESKLLWHAYAFEDYFPLRSSMLPTLAFSICCLFLMQFCVNDVQAFVSYWLPSGVCFPCITLYLHLLSTFFLSWMSIPEDAFNMLLLISTNFSDNFMRVIISIFEDSRVASPYFHRFTASFQVPCFYLKFQVPYY